jgi:hypothetical protein
MGYTEQTAPCVTQREYISRAWIAKSLQDREKEVPAVELAFVESDLVQMGLQLE